MRLGILLAGLLVVAWASAALADSETSSIIIKEQQHSGTGGTPRFFDQQHNDSWAADALQEVSGTAPPAGATAAQMAELVYAELAKLPTYGEKSVAMMPPAAPDWYMEGYGRYNGATVARSRYFDGVVKGTLEPNADIAALYAYWCLYDAEWFSLSRQPGFKAWLSAVALTYAPQWLRLRGESADQLHTRLVAPLQTPDEPWREIDNWISRFSAPSGSGQLGAFIKPKVRDALVEELIAAAGMDADQRFYEKRAYTAPAPERVGLPDRKFFLLGALTVEYFQELYAAHPDTKQPLFFRDYFVDSFRAAR